MEHPKFMGLIEDTNGMYNSEYFIRQVMKFRYTREEAINILAGKNPDGSEFVQLPF